MKKWTKILLGTITVLSFAGLGLGIKACEDKRKANSNSNSSEISKDKISSINQWTENIQNVNTKYLDITLPSNFFNINNIKWLFFKSISPRIAPPVDTSKIPSIFRYEIKQFFKKKIEQYLINQIGLEKIYWDLEYQIDSIFDKIWNEYLSKNSNWKWEYIHDSTSLGGGSWHGSGGKTLREYYVTSLTFKQNISFTLKTKIRSEYKAFDIFKNELNRFISKNSNVDLTTDYNRNTIDDYSINDSKYELFKTNKYYFLEWAKKLDKLSFTFDNETWRIKYEINDDNKTINIYMVNEKFGIKTLLIKNQGFNFIKSNKLNKLDIISKFNLSEVGQYLNFNKINSDNPTGMSNDEPKRINNDKPIGLSGNNYYLGTYKLHTLAKFSFTAPNDNYVVKVNGKKVDVINNKFDIPLTDNRNDASDDERIHNDDVDKSKPKDENNSHKKNEYTITIEEYDNINTDATPKITYTKKYIIETKTGSLDFKWYAWDPKNNKNQQELIEEYLKDGKGDIKRDDNGEPIKNPKYDPLIDKNTGTKKELVWFDTSKYSLSDDIQNMNSIEKIYAQKTGLPPYAYTLLNSIGTKIRDKGFIAEASVVSKGALRQLFGEIKDYYMLRLDNNSKFNFNKWTNPTKLENKVSENSYISNEGLYLFYTRSSDGSISNFKLLRIKNDDNMIGKTFTEINDVDSIKNLWKTTAGEFFARYLEKKHNIYSEQLNLLKYEKIQEYWRQYITYLAKGNSEDVNINPNFNFSSENNKFKNNQEFLSYLKNNNIDLIKKYANFAYKELVEIAKFEFISETEFKLTYKLRTSDLRYKLLTNSQIYRIDFLNQKNKNRIHIDWRFDYLKKQIKNNSKSKFLKWLNKSYFDLIGNSDNDKDKLTFDWYILNDKIYLTFKLKDKYTNDWYLTSSSISMDTDFRPSSLFDDFDPNKINLKGEIRNEKIKNLIIEQIKNQISNYLKSKNMIFNESLLNIPKLNESILNLLRNVYLTNDNALKNIVKLKVLYKNNEILEELTFEVINFANSYVSKPIDLSKINLSLYDINFDVSNNSKEEYEKKRLEIANLLKDYIQKELTKIDSELILGTNVIYNQQQFETIIDNLFYRNIVSRLNLFSNHPMISGTTHIDLKNTHNSTRKFNFDNLLIDDLELKSNNFNEIKSKIIDWVQKEIKNKNSIFNLIYGKDYVIENIDNPKFLKSLISKKGKNSLTFKLKPTNENYEGESKFNVINDFDGNLSTKDKNSWKQTRKLSSIAIGLITTISIFTFIGMLISLIILIYRRRTRKTK